MKQEAQVPLTARAFDDPGTQEALQQAWRRARVRFGAWTVVWALLLVAVGVFRDRDMETVRAIALILMLGSLRRLVRG